MEPADFEREVRRIARILWPSAADGGGAEMEDGKERDGIFITDDMVHIVEATTSAQMWNAEKNLEKMFALYKSKKSEHVDKGFKCWYVTKNDPTADQRSVRKKEAFRGAPDNLFNIVSFDHFQSKIIRASEYIACRNNHPFGSVYDPVSQKTNVAVPYVDVGINCDAALDVKDLDAVCAKLISGFCFVLSGDYGVGKSMTMRELYFKLNKLFSTKATHKFPVYINLREHHGQTNPAEILERHARNIGFNHPNQLVKAWRAGYVSLLLDGFDEIASSGLQGAWRKLRTARQASMAGIKELIRGSPSGCGIIVAGRDTYLGSNLERNEALGINNSWINITLDAFTDLQISKLLKLLNYSGPIPSWIPAKPLLLATLISRASADGGDSNDILKDSSRGWDALLTEICNREARAEQGITGSHLRNIVEILATLARSKADGLGPISSGEIIETFKGECGQEPADQALTVLQRLPGLGRDSRDEESRCFIDADFVSAAGAGDLVRFSVNPHDEAVSSRLSKAARGLGPVGLALAVMKMKEMGFENSSLSAWFAAVKKIASPGGNALGVDGVLIAVELGLPVNASLEIRNIEIDRLEIYRDGANLSRVRFVDCWFNSLEFSASVEVSAMPEFVNCTLQSVEGRMSAADMPSDRFVDCEYGDFVNRGVTNAALLDLDLPIKVKVMLTVLKKLFVQSSGGRLEGALYRGLDQAASAYVPEILRHLSSEGVAEKSNQGRESLWLPVRRQRGRVISILKAPSLSLDKLVKGLQ